MKICARRYIHISAAVHMCRYGSLLACRGVENATSYNSFWFSSPWKMNHLTNARPTACCDPQPATNLIALIQALGRSGAPLKSHCPQKNASPVDYSSNDAKDPGKSTSQSLRQAVRGLRSDRANSPNDALMPKRTRNSTRE